MKVIALGVVGFLALALWAPPKIYMMIRLEKDWSERIAK